MSIAVIDAREWQNTFDLRTGEKIQDDGPCVSMAKGVLERHPFPGDMDEKGNAWVTDVALDFLKEYDPDFIWLTYARQYYLSRYNALTPEERAEILSDTFRQVERFAESSGFTPVIVGTGDMADFRGFIDITKLDGLALSTHWYVRYAGLHDASMNDLERLKSIEEIEQIVSREELIGLFPESPVEPERVPDYILVARDGYAFKATGGSMRRIYGVPAPCLTIPVSLHAGCTDSITGIRGIVEQSLLRQKTALVVLEGVGHEDFPWPHSRAANGRDWYFYEPGDAQYLSIASGEHRLFDYPMGYRYFNDDADNEDYPLSGFFKSIPQNTIGQSFSGRSVAVGNRSMYTHMVPGADISLECFARNLYNQGTMSVIHRQDKI